MYFRMVGGAEGNFRMVGGDGDAFRLVGGATRFRMKE